MKAFNNTSDEEREDSEEINEIDEEIDEEESEENNEESEEESEENELPDLPEISLKAIKGISSALVSLKREDGSPLVTLEQGDNLSNLKFSNGEKILTMEERWFLYEIAWLLSQKGYEITNNYLSVDWVKILGGHNIRKKMLFENPLMDKNKEKFLIDMEIFRNKADVVVGLERCKRCAGKNTISAERVTRSCDEAVSIFVKCMDCGFSWRAQ